jgi:hypothetical protein
LSEEHRLRIFENRVLRFGPERQDGLWRKLHNDELHSLYSSPNTVWMVKSRRMRWAERVLRMGEGKGVSFFFFWKAGREDLAVGGRITLIRWTLGEIGIDEANRFRLGQDEVRWWAFFNAVMNFRVP